MEALEFLVANQDWVQARPLADRLKAAPTESAEVKLIIAKALLKGGDVGSAKIVTDQAKELLAKNPPKKSELELNYSDVLNPAVASTTVTTPIPTQAGLPFPGMMGTIQPPNHQHPKPVQRQIASPH
jgi:hypothetical protein